MFRPLKYKFNLESLSDGSKAQKNPTLIVIVILEELIISHGTSGNGMDINQHRVGTYKPTKCNVTAQVI